MCLIYMVFIRLSQSPFPLDQINRDFVARLGTSPLAFARSLSFAVDFWQVQIFIFSVQRHYKQTLRSEFNPSPHRAIFKKIRRQTLSEILTVLMQKKFNKLSVILLFIELQNGLVTCVHCSVEISLESNLKKLKLSMPIVPNKTKEIGSNE